MPTFHNVLSVLVHGKGLYRLVAEAADGVAESFFKAVQIDRTVLFLEPLKSRVIRAQLTNDQAFLRDLSYRLQNPITKSKLRRRKLWLLFALLDSEDLLEPMDGRRLLEVCQAVGCYGDEYGNSDEKSLLKRRREYFQNRGPSKYF